jgi:hypothetical protein
MGAGACFEPSVEARAEAGAETGFAAVSVFADALADDFFCANVVLVPIVQANISVAAAVKIREVVGMVVIVD